MGMDARNPGYMKSSDPESSQNKIEAGPPTATDDLTRIQSLTVEELSLSLEAVIRKVTVIEGRMSILEASLEVLLEKTAELGEELRLTNEQLEIRNHALILLRRCSRTENNDIVEEAERLRMENTDER